ncbi:MAG: glycosyl hydrolase family 18 protein [Caulobacteraceae bacterium]
MKRYALVIAAAFIVALAAVITIFPNYWTTTLYDPAKTHLVVEGDIVDENEPPIIENGEVLLPYETVKKYIDPKVYWDKKVGKVVFTTKDKVVIMKTDKLSAMVNAKPVDLNIPVRLVDGTPYIPVEFTSDLFGIELKWVKENNVVILDYKKSRVQIAEPIAENLRLRLKPSRFSPVLKSGINPNDKFRVFGENEKWYKVRTDEGLIGYLEKKQLKTSILSPGAKTEEPSPSSAWKPEKGKVNLVWEYVGSKNPNTANIKKMEGLDVVSPTWFNIVDKQGTVANKADSSYVAWAHGNGYKVWALVGNGSDKDITHAFLNNTDTREKIVQQLLIYAKLYKLDGINIDFENIYGKDRDMLTQFMREMAPLLREQGMVVSMDVTFRSSSDTWSKCYDRKALAEVVDYMAVMAYDQNGTFSTEPGSVAQYNWVEGGLVRILEEVPEDKLLLGLPFYAREWKEEKVDGKIKVTSKALSMDAVNKIIAEKKPVVTWDEESGQFYTEFKEGKATYKIWIENKDSINLKSSLVHKYKLAGAASWRRGFETEDVWKVLADTLKVKQDYTQWTSANSFENMKAAH